MEYKVTNKFRIYLKIEMNNLINLFWLNNDKPN
ncbi:hypothetical protein J3D55_002270 [Chryseobacterium ginsenosidimutans]|nr:hypothetical protein [Chryseobacterium ginsenosidimutans]